MSAQASSRDEQDMATAEKVFSRELENLALQLEMSCTTVASKAFAAGLIGRERMNQATNKEPWTPQQRTLYLLGYLGEKMDELDPALGAKLLMDDFMAILEHEPAYSHLVEKIKEERTKEPAADSQVFMQFQDDLASLVHYSVISVATAAYAKEMIPSDVKDIACNPKANHDNVCIVAILEEISRQIRNDPTKLKKFIEKVMKPLGPTVQHLTDKLERGLNDLQEDIN